MATDNVEVQRSQFSLTRGVSFLRESVDELKKVTHPTRAETTQATIVALLIILFVAICLFLVDIIFNRLMLAVLS